MVWENNFFYLLFLNAITGNVAFVLGYKLVQIAKKHGDARMVYNLLRGMVVFFTVPFSYLYALLKCFGEVNGRMFSYRGNQYIAETFHRLFLVWLIFTSAIAILYVCRTSKYRKLRVYNVPYYDERLRELFASFYPRSRLAKVKMYKNMMCPTPCIMGVLRPILVLPEVPYSREELVIMMAHEATHVIHRDTLWKTIGRVIQIMCWWNPFLYFFVWYLEDWSETYCDDTVCRMILNGDRQRYARVLTTSAMKAQTYYSAENSRIAMFGDAQTLYRRIRRLSKLNMGKRKRALCILLSAVFVLCSGTTAIAAGETASVLGQNVYENTYETRTTENAYIDLNNVDNVTVFRMTPEEMEAEGIEITTLESDVATYGTQKNFNWDVAASTMAASGTFLKRKDTTIHVSCYVTFPSGQSGSVRVGVIEPDGTFVYTLCYNNDTALVKYTCETLGLYSVGVHNLRSHSINASGYYVR